MAPNNITKDKRRYEKRKAAHSQLQNTQKENENERIRLMKDISRLKRTHQILDAFIQDHMPCPLYSEPGIDSIRKQNIEEISSKAAANQPEQVSPTLFYLKDYTQSVTCVPMSLSPASPMHSWQKNDSPILSNVLIQPPQILNDSIGGWEYENQPFRPPLQDLEDLSDLELLNKQTLLCSEGQIISTGFDRANSVEAQSLPVFDSWAPCSDKTRPESHSKVMHFTASGFDETAFGDVQFPCFSGFS